MQRVLILMFLTPTAMAQEWQPSAADLAVHKALSGRHQTHSCAEVEALSDTPVASLRNIVTHATAPPWAPMRAASCLVERHATEVQSDLERWVSDEATLGLGIQTLGQLDLMPEDVAIAVANKALTDGPPSLDAAARVSRSDSSVLRALVPSSPTGDEP